MGYSVMLLGEKEGFQKRIFFRSELGEQEISRQFEQFRSKSSGVVKDHLPFRCPIRKADTDGRYELVFEDRNLTYNFDPLLQFLADVISEGSVKAAKVLDNGRIGATAYMVTPGNAEKFEFFPMQDILSKIQTGSLSYSDVLKKSKQISLAEYASTIG